MDEMALVIRPPAGPGAATEIGIAGPVTHATASALREHLHRLIDAAGDAMVRVRLDLACCTDINLDGMFALAVARDDAHRRGGDLHLVNVPP